MSAKRASFALLELDTALAEFAAGLDPRAYDADKRGRVSAFVCENVMGTWTLTLAAKAAGVTEEQVVGALLGLVPLRCGTYGYGRTWAALLFSRQLSSAMLANGA